MLTAVIVTAATPTPNEGVGRVATGGYTTIEFWYSIPTVFKTGQVQSEYSPGIITVRIQSETFFVIGIQSQYSRIVSGMRPRI